MTVFVNYYDVLEVSKGADAEAVKAAAKVQRRVWSKRQSLADQERRHEAELRMTHIAEAERTLIDPRLRAQFDGALEAYRPPLPSGGAGVRASTGEGWIERALEFLHVGDAFSANYAAKEATSLTEQSDRAWSVRAQSSLLLGNERDAVFELNEALRINPSNPDHHFDLGTIFESAGQWGDALTAFRESERLDPSEAMYRVAQASVKLQSSKCWDALEIMDKVVAGEPDNVVWNNYLGMALHDCALETWTPLRYGTFVITKEEQIAASQRLIDRALGLRLDDQDLVQALREKRAQTAKAAEMEFRMPFRSSGGFAWGAFLYVPLIVLAAQVFLGILAFAASGAAVYYLGYKPVWHWNNADTRGAQLT